MSRIILLNEENIASIKADFDAALKDIKLSDGKFTFSKDIGKIDRRAKLYFTELSWWKMISLVDEFNDEVAWHGLARRGDNPEEDTYIIYDILVYPQEVTGSTVNTDQAEYQMWLMSHDDDVFNNIRMQGHSHVNMGVTPSGVDTTLYEKFLGQLEEDMFYIFLIWNKKMERTIKIYDLAKNVLFETSDVDVYTLDDGTGIQAFLKEAKDSVKKKSFVPKTTYNGYQSSMNKSKKKNVVRGDGNLPMFDEYDEYFSGYPFY